MTGATGGGGGHGREGAEEEAEGKGAERRVPAWSTGGITIGT